MNSSGSSTALKNFAPGQYLQGKAQQPGETKTRTYKYNDFGKAFCSWLMMNPLEGEVIDWEEIFGRYKAWSASLLESQFASQAFTFGKYNGHPIAQVLVRDQPYCLWVAFEVQGTQRAEARMLEKWFWATGVAPRRELRAPTNKPWSKNPSAGNKWSKKRLIPVPN